MSENDIVSLIKEAIQGRGLKIKYVAEKTDIDVQRLSRVFNQGAKLTVEEFLKLCDFLKLPSDVFKYQSSA